MTNAVTWRLGRRPELDAVRGIAVLAVVAGHSFGVTANGGSGVAVFFALSGFLITSLLLAELDGNGGLDLPAFYRRRAVRLLPALGVFLAVVVALGALLGPQWASPTSALLSVFYLRDLVSPSDGLHHTWSLAVEEQFYLVWPLLLVWLGRRLSRDRLLTVTVGLAVTAFLVMSVEPLLGLGAWVLLAGSAAAIWRSAHPGGRPSPYVAAGCLVGFGAVVLTRGAMLASGAYVAGVLTVVALLALTAGPGGGLPRRSSPEWLVLVGQRSYALYLWHFPLVIVARRSLPDGLLTVLLLLVASWVLANLSWHLVEQPAQRRWRARRTTDRSRSPG